MSVRERRLCDFDDGWGHTPRLCTAPASAACVFCDRDACSDHALHPSAGMILKLESLTTMAEGVLVRDIPWGWSGNNPKGYDPPAHGMFVCKECRKALGDPGSEHDANTAIRVILSELAEVFIKKARAKLAEKLVSAKKK